MNSNGRIPLILGNSTVASASTTAAAQYDVFLSFCGQDTRKGFTDFLYTYLKGATIRTFKDNKGLHVGEEIGPVLLKALKESKISIPIFSKNYAFSEWCLRELVQMVQCHENEGQVIYPIFYDVDPYDVRHQSGSYEAAFRQHRKKRFKEKTIQGWKQALKKVGQMKGLELKKETNGHEGELVKKAVEMVLFKLKKNYTNVSNNLVGMEEHIKEMERLLNVSSNGVRIVGIHGMGGLGKTTIAKVIYNNLCERFECSCFLDDVRENWQQSNGIVNLQKKLLSKFTQNEKISEVVDNVSEGINLIKNAIHGKKILIVLDDVEKISQFDELAGSCDWFASGSRIIVTTRNKEVLDSLEARNEEVLDSLEAVNQRKGLFDVFRSYEPPFMNPDVSLQLFSKHAFMRDSPTEEYYSLAKDFVSVAAGLPLVLVTIGSLLFGKKDKALWEEKRRELQEIPHKEVQRKLKISFEALTHEEQQIFLDIACFFIGHSKTGPCYMWEDCGFYPRNVLNVLVLRFLIKVGDDDTFQMHDQLRDLGRHIVREGKVDDWGRWSRLWNTKKAMEVYTTGQGTENVKALCLPKYQCLAGQKFLKLPNLRFLNLEGADLDGDFEHCLPNLRWLRWRKSKMNFSPTNFHLRNLVILDLLFSHITEESNLWSQIKMSTKLKVLDLEYCWLLRRVPSLSAFSNLERLVVHYCYSLRSLDGIEELESLRYLNASECNSLKALPNLSRLRQLKELNVSNSELVEVPGLDRLESLERLYMRHCKFLKRLPDLSNLKKLRTLDVSYCYMLIEIQGLDRLDSLENLDIFWCTSLEIPALSNLKNLKTLHYNNEG